MIHTTTHTTLYRWMANVVLVAFLFGMLTMPSQGQSPQQSKEEVASAEAILQQIYNADITHRVSESSVLNKMISVDLTQASVLEALKTIAGKADLSLSYNTQLSVLNKRLSYQNSNVSILDALWMILRDTQLGFAVSADGQLILMKKEEPFSLELVQETITGTVSDAQTGETLPGVNILVKGTSTGTSTDTEGNFEFTVPSLQDTLVVSFVGYQTQEVPINGQTEIDVVLQSQAITGEEMVVVGYTQKRKGEVTGSVSQISGETITESPENNITQAIQGKIPGVTVSDRGGAPGSNNANILVRGQSTLGDNSPLYVIDGVPRSEDDFANLAPNDIESVSVLKDASAAIYGARAANGVILVQTKHGQAGEATISFQTEYGIQAPSSTYKAMDSYQRSQYNYEASTYAGVAPIYTQEEIEHFKNGDEPLRYPNTNWADINVDQAASQSHYNLSAQGGVEKIQYFVSGDYRYQQGLWKSGDLNFRQYQIRSNVDAQPRENIDIGLSVSLREGKQQAPYESNPFSGNFEYPWLVDRWPNGFLGPIVADTDSPYTRGRRIYGFNDENNRSFSVKFNFSYDMDWITSGFQLSGYADFARNYFDSRDFDNTWEMYLRDPQTGEYTAQTGATSVAQGGRKRVFSNSGNFSKDFYHLRLSYDNSFNKHNISGFVAYEQSKTVQDSLNAGRTGLPSDRKPYLFAGIQEERTNSESVFEGGRINYFGSISYNYAQKYLMNFTLRYDGSFNFAPKDRFGLFPGISVGYNIANEPFMTGIDWLQNLKLRASYAQLGNDVVPNYQYLSTYNYENAYALGINPTMYKGFFQNTVPNPNITWEVAKQYNIGLDLTVMEGLFTLTADYFFEKRRGILLSRGEAVPTFTGLSLPDENFGKVNNRGIELNLTHQNVFNTVNYNITGNFTFNRSKIIDMAEPQDTPEWRQQEGHPIGSFLVYKSDGIYNSQEEIENSVHLSGAIPGDINYQDVDGNGQITGNDMIRTYASVIPEIQYGINGTVNYKNLGLSVFFQGQLNATTDFTFADAHTLEVLYTKRWTQQNENAEFPRAFLRDDNHNKRDSEFWLRDASFLRFKSATISYSLPRSWLSTVGISNLRVYARGRNLKTWSKMIGNFDPEKSNGIFPYPQITRAMIGAKIDF